MGASVGRSQSVESETWVRAGILTSDARLYTTYMGRAYKTLAVGRRTAAKPKNRTGSPVMVNRSWSNQQQTLLLLRICGSRGGRCCPVRIGWATGTHLIEDVLVGLGFSISRSLDVISSNRRAITPGVLAG